MPLVEVDFETYKELVNRRPSENISEGDVIRQLLFGSQRSPAESQSWVSEGAIFSVGTKLRHRFRSGKIVEAEIVTDGVKVDGHIFQGVSPAAVQVAGHQANGWQFWEFEFRPGQWSKIDTLRHGL